MKKPEAERGIRYLCTKWAKSEGLSANDYENASFSDFRLWLNSNHPEYLAFRTTMGVMYDIEMWFEQEMNQTSWR